MKHHLYIVFSLIGFIALSNVESSAQSANGSESDGRACRILFPERPNDAPKFAYLFDGRESRRVTLFGNNFSEVITLPPGDLTLTLTPDKVDDSKDLPAEAPRLAVSKEIKDFYILVDDDASNETLPLKLKLVDAGEDQFGPGDTLWINNTSHRIEAVLGGEKFSVEPNSRKISKSPVDKSGYYRAEFSYQADGNGKMRKITEQQWWNDVNCRHLGFIVDTGGTLPKIFFFRDFRS